NTQRLDRYTPRRVLSMDSAIKTSPSSEPAIRRVGDDPVSSVSRASKLRIHRRRVYNHRWTSNPAGRTNFSNPLFGMRHAAQATSRIITSTVRVLRWSEKLPGGGEEF